MSSAAGPGLVLWTAILIGGCGTVSTSNPAQASPGQPSPTQASPIQSGSGLPPCATITATGCDRSALQDRGRGSAACRGKGPGTITASPIALEELAYVQPMGLMIGGHVTPIDHGYFYTTGAAATPPRQTAVYAPMDGNVSSVTRTVRQSGPPQTGTYDDYAIT